MDAFITDLTETTCTIAGAL